MANFNVDEVMEDAGFEKGFIGNALPVPDTPRESTFHPFSVPQRLRVYPSLLAPSIITASTTTTLSHSAFSNPDVSGLDQAEVESSCHSGESGSGLAEVVPGPLDV